MYQQFSDSDKPQIRLTRPTDVNMLTSLDLKCYHYPMDLPKWQEYIKEVSKGNRIVVMEQNRTPVGFAAWEIIEDLNAGTSYANITRLGIHPEYRRMGHGKQLLTHIEVSAARAKADGVSVVIPEIHCSPGDPDDISEFLALCGYFASGAIVYNFRRMYGQMVDGFYFVKRLP